VRPVCRAARPRSRGNRPGRTGTPAHPFDARVPSARLGNPSVHSDARTSAPLRLPGVEDTASRTQRGRRTVAPTGNVGPCIRQIPHSHGRCGRFAPVVAPRHGNSPAPICAARSRDPTPRPPLLALWGPHRVREPPLVRTWLLLGPGVLAGAPRRIRTRRWMPRWPLDGSVRIRATCGSGTSAGLYDLRYLGAGAPLAWTWEARSAVVRLRWQAKAAAHLLVCRLPWPQCVGTEGCADEVARSGCFRVQLSGVVRSARRWQDMPWRGTAADAGTYERTSPKR
jgi:hypothetical protein